MSRGPDPKTRAAQEPTHVLAAGGLVEHVDETGRVRIPVVRRTRYRDRHGEPGDWVLPKGKLEAGEVLEEAALREVAEETGFQGRILGPTFPCQYEVGGVPKLVVFFRMERVGAASVRDSSEVREVAWLTPRDALGRLTYPAEREVLQQAYPEPRTCREPPSK